MSELVYLPVEQLWPHPDNPRKVVDDLEELAASIRENGVLQNLTVVHVPEHAMDEGERRKVFEETQRNGVDTDAYKQAKALLDSGSIPEHYTVIIGHRRLAAAKLAGLEKVPCVIAEMTEKEQIQTMLLENMQRKDLKVYEEAQAFQLLLDFGDTVEEVSEKSGFSATTIRRRVKLTELDQAKLKEIVDSRPISLSDFEELNKIEDLETRNEVLEKIGTDNFKYAVNEAVRKQAAKKVLPEIERMFKEYKIKKVNSYEVYDNTYSKIGDSVKFTDKDWPKNKTKLLGMLTKKLGKNKDAKACCVLNENWGEITFYVRTKPKKAEANKEESAKVKAAKEAWEELKRQCNEIRLLRKAFVDELKCTAKNKMIILEGALMAGLSNAALYEGSDHDTVRKLLQVEENSLEWGQREAFYAMKIPTVEPKDWPKLVYCLFNDTESKCLTTNDGYKSKMPEYNPQAHIILLYKWLVKLGYEVSDKEHALVYGSDEIYENATAGGECAKPVPEADTPDQDGGAGEV